MCVKITSENFILNYFGAKQVCKASLKELETKKCAVEKVFNNNVYIDLYKTSIREAIYYNRKYLSFGNGKSGIKSGIIRCRLDNIHRDHILDNLNSSLPAEVKSKYLTALAV